MLHLRPQNEASSAHVVALESQLAGSIGDSHLAMLTATELEVDNVSQHTCNAMCLAIYFVTQLTDVGLHA